MKKWIYIAVVVTVVFIAGYLAGNAKAKKKTESSLMD
jgi:uncharacterized protein YneF (UPF0154 family)